MSALWSLLPPYVGAEPLTLYRGESFRNRRRRTYGLAWTVDREVARSFASDRLWRTSKGGSILLKTIAPAAAVISAPALIGGGHPTEQEYLVDRRLLRRVEVVERFSQVAP